MCAVPSTLTRGGGQQNSTWSSPTADENSGRYYEIHHQRDAPARLEVAPSLRCCKQQSRTTRPEPQLSRNTQTRFGIFRTIAVVKQFSCIKALTIQPIVAVGKAEYSRA